MGTGDTVARPYPTVVDMSTVPVGDIFLAVASAYLHTCAITNTGSAYCFGANGPSLRLCSSFTGNEALVPQLVLGSFNWLLISPGYTHTCGIVDSINAPTGTGIMACCGDNSAGQLGLGTTGGSFATPQPVSTTSPIPPYYVSVAAGESYTCSVSSTGRLYCVGSANNGQTGTTTGQSGGAASINLLTPVITSGLDDPNRVWNSIDVGRDTTCSIPVTNGASPSVSPLPSPPLLALGGSLCCFGSNTAGALGLGENSYKTTYAIIPQATVRPPLQADFSPYSWSKVSVYDVYDEQVGLTDTPHVCAIAKMGQNQIACWGSNSKGQIGSKFAKRGTDTATPLYVQKDDDSTLRGISVCTGYQYSCAVSITHQLYCWGNAVLTGMNNNNPTDLYRFAQFVSVTNATTGLPVSFASVSCGGYHAVALATSGEAYAWGYNYFGATGTTAVLNSLVRKPTIVTGGYRWQKLVAGANHTCGITITGQGYCMGRINDGALGTADVSGNNYRSSPVPISLKNGGIITDIAVGLRVTTAIRQGGIPNTNTDGLDGNNTVLNNDTFVSPYSSAAYTLSNAIAWGLHARGTLGISKFIPSTATPVPTPVPVIPPNKSFNSSTLLAYYDQFGHQVPQVWQSLTMSTRYVTCGILGYTPYCWGDATLGSTGTSDQGILLPTPKPVDLTAVPNTLWLQIDAGAYTTCGIITTSTYTLGPKGGGTVTGAGGNNLDEINLFQLTQACYADNGSWNGTACVPYVSCSDTIMGWTGAKCDVAFLPLVCEQGAYWDMENMHCLPVGASAIPVPSSLMVPLATGMVLHVYVSFRLSNIDMEVFNSPENHLAFKQACISTFEGMGIHNVNVTDINIVSVFIVPTGDTNTPQRLLWGQPVKSNSTTINGGQLSDTDRWIPKNNPLLFQSTTETFAGGRKLQSGGNDTIEIDLYILTYDETTALNLYQLLAYAGGVNQTDSFAASMGSTFLALLLSNLVNVNPSVFSNVPIIGIDSNPPILVNGQAISGKTSTPFSSELSIGSIIGIAIAATVVCGFIVYGVIRIVRANKFRTANTLDNEAEYNRGTNDQKHRRSSKTIKEEKITSFDDPVNTVNEDDKEPMNEQPMVNGLTLRVVDKSMTDNTVDMVHPTDDIPVENRTVEASDHRRVSITSPIEPAVSRRSSQNSRHRSRTVSMENTILSSTVTPTNIRTVERKESLPNGSLILRTVSKKNSIRRSSSNSTADESAEENNNSYRLSRGNSRHSVTAIVSAVNHTYTINSIDSNENEELHETGESTAANDTMDVQLLSTATDNNERNLDSYTKINGTGNQEVTTPPIIITTDHDPSSSSAGPDSSFSSSRQEVTPTAAHGRDSTIDIAASDTDQGTDNTN